MTTKIWFFELWRGVFFSNAETNKLIDRLIPIDMEQRFLTAFWNIIEV